MHSVNIAEVAQHEIDNICNYLQDTLKSEQAKDNFTKTLALQIDLLSMFPKMYPRSPIPEIAEFEGRIAPVNNYVLVYVVEDDAVNILHAFHSRQDYGHLI